MIQSSPAPEASGLRAWGGHRRLVGAFLRCPPLLSKPSFQRFLHGPLTAWTPHADLNLASIRFLMFRGCPSRRRHVRSTPPGAYHRPGGLFSVGVSEPDPTQRSARVPSSEAPSGPLRTPGNERVFEPIRKLAYPRGLFLEGGHRPASQNSLRPKALTGRPGKDGVGTSYPPE